MRLSQLQKVYHYTVSNNVNDRKKWNSEQNTMKREFRMVSAWICYDKKILHTFRAKVYTAVEKVDGEHDAIPWNVKKCLDIISWQIG